MDDFSNSTQTAERTGVDALPTSEFNSQNLSSEDTIWADESPADETDPVSEDINPFAIEADDTTDVAPLLQVPAVTPVPEKARPMDKRRFLSGLAFATGGMALMLIVAIGALHSAGASGRLSLPAVAVCMIIGLMLLGGGFGIMATAAATFDDGEFERLMHSGDAPVSVLPDNAAAPEAEDRKSASTDE